MDRSYSPEHGASVLTRTDDSADLEVKLPPQQFLILQKTLPLHQNGIIESFSHAKTTLQKLLDVYSSRERDYGLDCHVRATADGNSPYLEPNQCCCRVISSEMGKNAQR